VNDRSKESGDVDRKRFRDHPNTTKEEKTIDSLLAYAQRMFRLSVIARSEERQPVTHAQVLEAPHRRLRHGRAELLNEFTWALQNLIEQARAYLSPGQAQPEPQRPLEEDRPPVAPEPPTPPRPPDIPKPSGPDLRPDFLRS
jgi:hypothetical protein